jgi:hypothetical protein
MASGFWLFAMKKQKRDHDWAKAKWDEAKDQFDDEAKVKASDGILISSYCT